MNANGAHAMAPAIVASAPADVEPQSLHHHHSLGDGRRDWKRFSASATPDEIISVGCIYSIFASSLYSFFYVVDVIFFLRSLLVLFPILPLFLQFFLANSVVLLAFLRPTVISLIVVVDIDQPTERERSIAHPPPYEWITIGFLYSRIVHLLWAIGKQQLS